MKRRNGGRQKCPRSWVPMLRASPLLVMLCLGRPTIGDAEAIGSPSRILKKGTWAMGLGGGGVLGRDLKGNAEATLYEFGHFRGYGVTDWLSLYGKLGVAFLEVDDPAIVKPRDSSSNNRFGTNVLVAIQTRTRLWQSPQKKWEWDGSLQYVDIRKRHQGKNEGRWHQWQVATSVARAFGRVKPYLGVEWSMVNFNFKIRQEGELLTQGRYHEDASIGPFFGTDVYLGSAEDVMVNLETSYVGGGEVDASIRYIF